MKNLTRVMYRDNQQFAKFFVLYDIRLIGLDAFLEPSVALLTGIDDVSKSIGFPFAGVAIQLVRGVVAMEVKREANSARCRALIFQMADMMGALLQMHDIKDPELKTDDGQTVIGRINALMGKIEVEIKKCGNLIDLYHNHHVISMWTFVFYGTYSSGIMSPSSSSKHS
jgi:hypothetical protein